MAEIKTIYNAINEDKTMKKICGFERYKKSNLVMIY